MENINRLRFHKETESQYRSEVLLKSYTRYTTPAGKQAMSVESIGLLHRKAFVFVKQNNTSPNENILGRSFILPIKQHRTPNERYKAKFIVQGHKKKDKDLTMHTSPTVLHRSIRLMSSIATMFPSHKIWL